MKLEDIVHKHYDCDEYAKNISRFQKQYPGLAGIFRNLFDLMRNCYDGGDYYYYCKKYEQLRNEMDERIDCDTRAMYDNIFLSIVERSDFYEKIFPTESDRDEEVL